MPVSVPNPNTWQKPAPACRFAQHQRTIRQFGNIFCSFPTPWSWTWVLAMQHFELRLLFKMLPPGIRDPLGE